MNPSERGNAATCPYCGWLDWTVRAYGRVTHKESCPQRTDPWHQGDPTAKPSGAYLYATVTILRHDW